MLGDAAPAGPHGPGSSRIDLAGLLDELNRLGFGYRWMTRFLFLDKREAERELTKLRRQWFAKRKSIVTLLRETIFQQESPLVDSDADNKAADADAALQELGSDAVAFGYITATIVVTDPRCHRGGGEAQGDRARHPGPRLRHDRRDLQCGRSLARPRFPGHVYANVRQPSSRPLNLAHLMPLSAVWAGPERERAPECAAADRDANRRRDAFSARHPCRAMSVIRCRRADGCRQVGAARARSSCSFAATRSADLCLRQGRSARATVLGLGGEHYDLGADGAIAFQPLARIDEEAERALGGRVDRGAPRSREGAAHARK